MASFPSSRIGLLRLFALVSLSAYFGMVVAQPACPNGGKHKLTYPLPFCASLCNGQCSGLCGGGPIQARCVKMPGQFGSQRSCECCCGGRNPPQPPVQSPPPPSPPPPSPPPPSPSPPPPSPPPPPPPNNDLCPLIPATSFSYPATAPCGGLTNPCTRSCTCPSGAAPENNNDCFIDTCLCCCK